MYDKRKPTHLPPAHRLPTLQPTNEEVRRATELVLNYNWDDEMKDFNENPDEHHIYLSLRVLHAHLYGRAR